MKFSLINVHTEERGRITGSLMQNHVGTLESALTLAHEIEDVNSNAIDVAVVPELAGRIGDAYVQVLRLRSDTRPTA